MGAKAERATRLRAEIHRLVDQLNDGELPAARRFVEFLRDQGDPFLDRVMEAPIDDEPVTAEEEAGAREAREELARGEGVPHAEVRHEFG